MLRIKTVATSSLAKAHKHGIAGTQREPAGVKETKELEQRCEKQEPPRSKASRSPQPQRPPGVKEPETRTTGVERFREVPATEAFRNKGRQDQELPTAYRNRGLQEQGNEKQGLPGSRAS